MTDPNSTTAGLAAALDAVRQRIADACAGAGRHPSEVTLLPVTKGVPAEILRHALGLGLAAFGENRVQEAEAKSSEVPAARFELIGRLQSNKAARAVALFEVIHSVDSVAIARRLDRLAGEADGRVPLPVYIEVNVDSAPAKAGFAPAELPQALADLANVANLELRGLMTVGRLVERPDEARTTFRALRRLAERLRSDHQELGDGLSMGMSADFEVAIEEGATLVRVGSAIFGPRPAG